jgi:hypothetical protein
VWTRPTPDRDETWVRPSYIPNPQQQPVIQPREEPRPLYAPAPEFKPAETPDKQKEMPEGPKMPGEAGRGADPERRGLKGAGAAAAQRADGRARRRPRCG